MSYTTVKPGPRRKSCLTCHQRRKKCDLSRPYCERCMISGFECLGYVDDRPRACGHQSHPSRSASSRLRPILSAILRCTWEVDSETPGSVATGPSEGRQDLDRADAGRNPRLLIQEATPLSRVTIPAPVANEDRTTIYTLEGSGNSWSQEENKPTIYRHLLTGQSPKAGGLLTVTTGTKPINNCLSKILGILHGSIPPAVNARRANREVHLTHILYEYRAQRCSLWFMSPPAAIISLLVRRLKGSKTMMWTLCLGIKLFQALSQNPCSTAVQEYIGWIDKLEQKFITDSRSNPPLDDTADGLLAQLEVNNFDSSQLSVLVIYYISLYISNLLQSTAFQDTPCFKRHYPGFFAWWQPMRVYLWNIPTAI
ncbi:hypothetical protein B0J17DRAFT_443654 [Rhizoctonia solani]|nr:hypothetical protein B0J17DRAFT_443654 [Rhizoctonia solani]